MGALSMPYEEKINADQITVEGSSLEIKKTSLEAGLSEEILSVVQDKLTEHIQTKGEFESSAIGSQPLHRIQQIILSHRELEKEQKDHKKMLLQKKIEIAEYKKSREAYKKEISKLRETKNAIENELAEFKKISKEKKRAIQRDLEESNKREIIDVERSQMFSMEFHSVKVALLDMESVVAFFERVKLLTKVVSLGNENLDSKIKERKDSLEEKKNYFKEIERRKGDYENGAIFWEKEKKQNETQLASVKESMRTNKEESQKKVKALDAQIEGLKKINLEKKKGYEKCLEELDRLNIQRNEKSDDLLEARFQEIEKLNELITRAETDLAQEKKRFQFILDPNAENIPESLPLQLEKENELTQVYQTYRLVQEKNAHKIAELTELNQQLENELKKQQEDNRLSYEENSKKVAELMRLVELNAQRENEWMQTQEANKLAMDQSAKKIAEFIELLADRESQQIQFRELSRQREEQLERELIDYQKVREELNVLYRQKEEENQRWFAEKERRRIEQEKALAEFELIDPREIRIEKYSFSSL